MKSLKHSVNDNHIGHCLYDGGTDHFPYVPAARYLIDKYISAYWKNDPNDIDFIHMELTLCGYMKMEPRDDIGRNLQIEWVARVLGVNSLVLRNDKYLPF